MQKLQWTHLSQPGLSTFLHAHHDGLVCIVGYDWHDSYQTCPYTVSIVRGTEILLSDRKETAWEAIEVAEEFVKRGAAQ